MHDNQREALEATLLRRLDSVNQWLKYGEAKNGILLTLCIAGLAGIASYVSAKDPINKQIEDLLVVGAGTLVAVSLPVLASFFPILNPTGALASLWAHPSESDNLEYFGHLRKYDGASLVAKIAERYFAGAGDEARGDLVLLDLADQVVTNSRIAWDKFLYFRASVYSLAVGFVAMGLTYVFF
jgi:hypothetical protein